MAIRGKSSPTEYPRLLKYLEIVTGLFNQGFDERRDPPGIQEQSKP